MFHVLKPFLLFVMLEATPGRERISDFGFGVSGFGFWFWDQGLPPSSFGFRVSGFGFGIKFYHVGEPLLLLEMLEAMPGRERVSLPGFRVLAFGFGIGSWFSVLGFGFWFVVLVYHVREPLLLF